jgi:hypothetical protein
MSYEINYIDLRVTQLEEESYSTKADFRVTQLEEESYSTKAYIEEIFKRLDEIEKQIRDMKGDQR